MKPVTFKQANVVFAKDQPEFIPLPAYADSTGQVITKWTLSAEELNRLILDPVLYLIQLKPMLDPLQPIIPSVECPFEDH
jgi:hypothetical protein